MLLVFLSLVEYAIILRYAVLEVWLLACMLLVFLFLVECTINNR
jgi:hypothetical protein